MKQREVSGVEVLEQLAGTTWAEIEARVLKRCRRLLAGSPDIDPRDASQDVLSNILCRRFLRQFDPQKGNFWQFVEGISRYVCLQLLRKGRRTAVHLDSVEEPAARHRAFDPVASAMDREFREALAEAAEHLTPAELSVFADVVERAEGSRFDRRETRTSVRHTRECRCRLRLRSLLVDFLDA